jgi:SLT domain-containing protein/phage-related protein
MATDIFVGSVSVGVVPDARGWNDKLRQDLVPSSAAVGDEVGKNISKGVTDNLGSNSTKASMAKAGDSSGGAFSDGFKKRLQAALDSLPKAKIDGDSTDAEIKVEELRKRMEELLGKEIGVDISTKEATAEILKIDTGLEEVRKASKDIRITFDTKEARAQLALLRSDAGKTSGGGIVSKIGGIFGGGGGAAAAAVPSAAPAAAPAGGVASLLSTGGIIAGIVAAIVALPFIAQAAAGAIVFALGGALAGLGVAGAIMSGKLTKQFTAFTAQAKKDLLEIGKAFIPVLSNIMKVASQVLKTLTPLFTSVVKMIAGPFKIFVDTVLRAFTLPAVVKSIRDVGAAFSSILSAFTPDIPGIATSLAQAISRIAEAVAKNPKAFADFLNFLFQIVIAAIDAIAWLTVAATYIETHFLPAIHDVANAFDEMRHDIAHTWDLIFSNTIGSVIRIVHNVETQFNSMRHEVAVIFDGMRHDIAHTWDQIYSNTVGAVIRVWQKTDTPFANMRHDIAGIMDGMRHDIAHTWDLIYQDTIGRVIRMAHDVEAQTDIMRNALAGIYDGIRHDISSVWDLIWNNTVGRALTGAGALMGVFTRLKNDILSWFSSTGSWLVSAGANIISGLLSGMSHAMGSIGSWIKGNVVDPIVNAVKHFFGISSPAAAMVPVGMNIMAGMIKGILAGGANLGSLVGKIFGGWPQALASLANKSLVDVAKLPAKALNALAGLTGKVGGAIGGFISKLFGGGAGGSGVQRWAGDVAKALGMLGLPLTLSRQVLYQMQTESGGNPNAINLTDINAQMGDPSRGLLQTIGSTFATYHVPGTSNNIYDPLANIAAAINYAQHRYGPTLMSGGMGMGSGHGYDSGGWLPPGVTMAVNNTGRPELVIPHSQLAGGIGGTEYHAHFDGLTGQAIEGYVRTAFRAMSLTSGNLNRQGRRV